MAQVVPSLMDELVEEILLRLSPDDPGSLLNATLVCKAWCRIVSSPGFNRRFRKFHQQTSPPVLGFFCSVCKPYDSYFSPSESRFVPMTTSFRHLPHTFMPNWLAVDARHGRVLFYDKDMVVVPIFVNLHLIVWNSITGEVSRLPVVPVYTMMDDTWSAALLCDHVDSHFRVVIATTVQRSSYVCVYSSEQHAWSTPISVLDPTARVLRGRSALIGNALYFTCHDRWILEYDMSKQELSLIGLPSEFGIMCIALMTAEDGALGFAVVLEAKLYTWSREVGIDGAGRWTQQRVFDLDNPALLTHAAKGVVAAENDLSVIFLVTANGLSVIDLKFQGGRKIYEHSGHHDIIGIVPYASFCTPVVWSGLYNE